MMTGTYQHVAFWPPIPAVVVHIPVRPQIVWFGNGRPADAARVSLAESCLGLVGVGRRPAFTLVLTCPPPPEPTADDVKAIAEVYATLLRWHLEARGMA